MTDLTTAYQRGPRRWLPRPDARTDSVEIAAPPARPAAPNSSLIPLLLPVGGVGLSLVLALTLGAGNAQFLLLSGPIMLLSVAGGVYGYLRERRRYATALHERDARYRRYLAQIRHQLVLFSTQLRTAWLAAHPPPAECQARAELADADRRLWERAPGDEDFLALRLGVGLVPAGFPVTVAQPPEALTEDPLFQAARLLAAELAQIHDAPVTVSLPAVGHLALTGPRAAQVATARALLAQLATAHAPDDVRLVACYPESEHADWAWLRWLPHVWDAEGRQRRLAATPDEARALLAATYDRLRSRGDRPGPATVLLLAHDQVLRELSNGPILRWLWTAGPTVGVYGLVLCPTPTEVPRDCGAVVAAERGPVRFLRPAETSQPYAPDALTAAAADRLARTLTARHPPLAGTQGLPATLPLLAALETTTVEALPILDWWRDHDPVRSLAVPVGVREDGRPLQLDLHERGHGPHGLVAGMTRSGKTTFLSAFLALLATGYHPHAVAILAIDYKGGDMVRDLQGLPHLLGVLTNLEPGLMQRALLSLKAELQRRQTIFNAAGVGNLYDYQRLWRAGQVTAPLPHLVLVADEFAELVKEQPEFIQELVSTARVGGSLGVHLILATQQPAGVVNDQIWGNARFRVAFKLANTEHSRAVLKKPDAALITVPGRAYLQVGEHEVYELWQAAYGGAPYQAQTGPTTAPEVALVALDGTWRPLATAATPVSSSPAGAGPTQLPALVARIRQVAEEAGITPLPGPWLPPLPATLPWAAVQPADWWDGQTWPAAAPLAPAVGLVDDPAHLQQRPLRLDLTAHLLIYGAPGTGKTTLAQTLALSLAGEHAPGQVTLCLVGRGLAPLAGLPHVAAFIRPEEPERLHRLAAWLRQTVTARSTATPGSKLPLSGGATSVSSGATSTLSGETAPALVVLVDGYAEVAAASPRLADTLAELSRESRAGLHLVLTAHAVNEIPARLVGNAGQAVALALHEANDYQAVVGRPGSLRPARGVRGRGLVRGAPPLEFQTAQPDLNLVAALAAAPGPRAPVLPELPAQLGLAVLVDPGRPAWDSADSPAVPLGLDRETLAPVLVGLSEGPFFTITGPYASGKTALLRAWLLALAYRQSPAQCRWYVVGLGEMSGLQGLRTAPHVARWATDEAALDELLADLQPQLDERYVARQRGVDPAPASSPTLLLVLDDLAGVRQRAGDRRLQALAELLRRHRGLQLSVLAGAVTTDIATAYDPLSKLLRETQTGVVLGSSETADLAVLGVRLPPGEAGRPLPPGQGFYTRRGRSQPLQAAWLPPAETPAWVRRLTESGA